MKDLINGYKILNEEKYFYSGILQNYLIFLSTRKYFRLFTHLRFYHEALKDCQKKVFRI